MKLELQLETPDEWATVPGVQEAAGEYARLRAARCEFQSAERRAGKELARCMEEHGLDVCFWEHDGRRYKAVVDVRRTLQIRIVKESPAEDGQ